jgi:hypothetical protein
MREGSLESPPAPRVRLGPSPSIQSASRIFCEEDSDDENSDDEDSGDEFSDEEDSDVSDEEDGVVDLEFPDYIIQKQRDGGSDDEAEDEYIRRATLSELEGGKQAVLQDKHGWQWSTMPPNHRVKRKAAQIFSETPGPTPAAQVHIDAHRPEAVFFLFLDEEMRSRIVEATNSSCAENMVPNWSPLTIIELNAFLGLLLQCGAKLLRSDRVSHMWSRERGDSFFM